MERPASSETPAAIGPASDRTLIDRMAGGDERAVQDLVARHGDALYALAYSILRDHAEAEEVAADSFVQAWRSADSFDPARGTPIAWLATITRTRSLDRLRAAKRRGRVLHADSAVVAQASGEVERTEEQPDRAYDAASRSQLVRRALDALPETQRRVIELAYFGGLSQSEIAKQLGLPLGTVKTRTLYAMKGLRAVLAPLMQEGVA